MSAIRAEFKKGIVSKTEGQEKKHYTQFTKAELRYLESRLRTIKDVSLTRHARNKGITINKGDIQRVLRSKDIKNQIIEFNCTRGDQRVLVRSRDIFDTIVDGVSHRCNICFIVSLKDGVIVTVYYDDVNDNHKTVDFSRYNKDLKII